MRWIISLALNCIQPHVVTLSILRRASPKNPTTYSLHVYGLFDLQLNINFLLTEREVFTKKCRAEVFFVQTEPVGLGLYKKSEVRYLSVKTEQARLIKSLLYGIYMHLYSKQPRNTWFEMNILVAWYTFGRRKQKLPMYSFLST